MQKWRMALFFGALICDIPVCYHLNFDIDYKYMATYENKLINIGCLWRYPCALSESPSGISRDWLMAPFVTQNPPLWDHISRDIWYMFQRKMARDAAIWNLWNAWRSQNDTIYWCLTEMHTALRKGKAKVREKMLAKSNQSLKLHHWSDILKP